MSYDTSYRENKHVFGIDSEKILQNFIAKIDKSRPVLDIGVGQGRNSLFLAKKGFSVDAIDTSQVAIETITTIAEKENYTINAYQNGFAEFNSKYPSYSAILVFGLLQILDWESIQSLIEKIDNWTSKGSLIFITAFSKKDATYNTYRTKWNEAGKNSLKDHKGNYRTYLEPNEILKLFDNYTVVFHWEGTGPKHRHGNNPVEQHEMIELVLEKR